MARHQIDARFKGLWCQETGAPDRRACTPAILPVWRLGRHRALSRAKEVFGRHIISPSEGGAAPSDGQALTRLDPD